MIQVKNLTKTYGTHLAVNNISFTIEKGNVYGFLGPNGAGKSTTMNIITGCLAATEGTVLIDGHDIFDEPDLAKKHIGYLPEIPPLYSDMTPYEYLTFVAEAKKVSHNHVYPQVKEVISITGLENHADRLIKNLSKGYKQRVGIAQAMLGDPDIIILDEPTVGLDPKQIIEIRELIGELGKIKTVILSSHILAEVASVCNHIIILSHGKIVANDKLNKLIDGFSDASGYEAIITHPGDKLDALISDVDKLFGCESVCEEIGSTIKITVNTVDGVDMREELFDLLISFGVKILELKRLATTLEDVFLRLTESDYSIKSMPRDNSDTAEDENDGNDNSSEEVESEEEDIDTDEDEDAEDEDESDDDNDDYTSLFSTKGGND